MFYLDSNVLLRCFVPDDRSQSPRALAFLKKALAGGEEVYIPDVVVMETIWALQKLYQLERETIVSAFMPLLVHPKIRFDQLERLQDALSVFASRPVSIVDAYLSAISSESSSARLVTFDRRLQSITPRYVEP